MSANEIVEQRLSEMAKDEPSTIFDVGFNSVVTAASKNFLKEGWDATVQKVALMEKVATLQDEDFVAGQQAAIELLSMLSENEYLSLIQGETQMSNFGFGKEAAYADFVEMAEDGAGFSYVMEAIQNTLSEDLEKNASEEDLDGRLGVESACYQFLKVANDVFGEFDTSDSSDEEILDVVLMKIAEEEEKSRTQRVKDSVRSGASRAAGFAGRHKKKLIGAGLAAAALAPGAYGAASGMNTNRGLRAAGEGMKYHQAAGEGAKQAYVGIGRAAKGAAGAAKAKASSAYNSVKERMGKKASDDRIEAALEILAEAGLLDD